MLYQNNAHWHGEVALAASVAVALVSAAAEDSLACISTSYKQSAKPTNVSVHTPPTSPPSGKEVARSGNGGSGGAGGSGEGVIIIDLYLRGML
jgi:hypothetical protein